MIKETYSALRSAHMNLLVLLVQVLNQRSSMFSDPAALCFARLSACEASGAGEENLWESDGGLFSTRGADAKGICKDKAL